MFLCLLPPTLFLDINRVLTGFGVRTTFCEEHRDVCLNCHLLCNAFEFSLKYIILADLTELY